VTTTNTLGSTILEPQQFDRFVRVMQNKAVLLPMFRLQVMDAPKADIDRIAFGQRVMGVPPAEGQPKSEGDFVSPASSRHQLEAEYMQGVVSLTDKLLRRTIERAALKDTVMDLIAERVGLDIEEQGLKGDSLSLDPYLALNDGWLKITRRRVVEDANQAYDDGAVALFTTGGAETTKTFYLPKLPITELTFELWESPTGTGTKVSDEDGDGVVDEVGGSGVTGTIDYESGKVEVSGLTPATAYGVKYTANSFDKTASNYPENLFDRLIRVVPKPYYGNPSEWVIAAPFHVIKAYRDRLKARNSALGDEAQVNGQVRLPYEGSWVTYVPNMPNNLVWLTHPDNTIYGVFHEVEIEQERVAKAKRYDIIVDAETDYHFEEPEASVVAEIY
jgi:hypothetical protein